jgi:SAM-dependent methyltransferase
MQREILGPVLALSLWSWAFNVFQPARRLKQLGLYQPNTLGKAPQPMLSSPSSELLSRTHPEPVFLEATPDNYATVDEFDHCAPGYDQAVRPFSEPIVEETLALLRPYVTSSSRILDPSCGPGMAALDLAALVPDGEVVAADLSRGMVTQAHQAATQQGRRNMAFFQADVAQPPAAFEQHFDAVYCCLSFHHYPDGAAAARAFARVLRPGGVAVVADGGPDWFIALARGISVLADPGFVRHRNGHEFLRLFDEAGFRAGYWIEALPGIGITIAQR